MDLLEYKAKDLFARYGITIPRGAVVDAAFDIKELLKDLGFPVVLKAQVQTGGRAKTGGVKFAKDEKQADMAAKSILKMNIKGHAVKEILVEEKVPILRELYLSIMLDRDTKSPVIIFSPAGGIDIEETARLEPEKVIKIVIDPGIGVRDYMVRYLLNRSQLDMVLYEALYAFIQKLYRLFVEYDCLLAEINPLVISTDGGLVALDGKVTVDDNALKRHSDMLALQSLLPEHPQVLEARKFNFMYIPCEPDGNIAVMSNGSGMIMSSMDLISKEGMKTGAAFDLGGGATSDRIAEAVRIVLSNESIDTLFINVFGGITRCDEVAEGVKQAIESRADKKTVVVRIEGTNREKGIEILSNIRGGRIIPVNSIKEGVMALISRRDGM